MPDCDAGDCPPARRHSRRRLAFLDLDATENFPVHRAVADKSGCAVRVELVMAAMARMSGKGRLRVATLLSCHPGQPVRSIYIGREPSHQDKHTMLAEAITARDGRQCSPGDFIFTMQVGDLGSRPSDKDILRSAVHNIALLIAAGDPTPGRSTTWLCACVVLMASTGNNARSRELVDDFLRMWLRAALGTEDPHWGHEAARRLRAVDPWAAAFMEGLGEAARLMTPLTFPASLPDIAEAAAHLQAAAILGQCTPAGSA